ncbi:hypothetical protein Q5H93_13170 [Hymenobacter sp. ASUV-10]|uniref:YcxB family protein n=1 Tax=Hymenobacter aranciens TaxID=3063996 RepID=A0ABT9BBP0_9BACT|nr:hypothetical protein [Hymenobacter sp. ASUV-10]MDO7875689.1 hypothetical protein [Hymenobacter sp. ASUV-10]
MRLTVSDKLEIMIRQGALPLGIGASLIALVSLLSLSASDDFLAEILGAAAILIFGLLIIYHSIDKHKTLWALADDASLVTGIYEKSRTTANEIDATTFYRLVYNYQFEGRAYFHCIETNNLAKYGDEELIFIQRSRPANAVFATDLPGVVREKLLLSASN